jgi:COP9 signalosome complex subunit 2
MTNLVAAYQRRDIHDAQKILRGPSFHTSPTLIIFSFPGSRVLSHSPLVPLSVLCGRAENKATILDDPFIKAYIDDVLRSLRTQYLIDLIKPYTRMEIKWLGKVCSLSLTCTSRDRVPRRG